MEDTKIIEKYELVHEIDGNNVTQTIKKDGETIYFKKMTMRRWLRKGRDKSFDDRVFDYLMGVSYADQEEDCPPPGKMNGSDIAVASSRTRADFAR